MTASPGVTATRGTSTPTSGLGTPSPGPGPDSEQNQLGRGGQTPLPPALKFSGAQVGHPYRLGLGLFPPTVSSCCCPSLSSSPFLLLPSHPSLGNPLALKHPNLPCFWPFLCCSFCLDPSDLCSFVSWFRAPVNVTSYSECPVLC